MDLGRARERRAVPALPGAAWADLRWADGEWTWPPGGSWPAADGTRWVTDEWAPATTVRRPRVRLGRWTLLYHRPGC